MRVLIIEPLLKNQRGHPYFYTSTIQSELHRRGISAVIFGNSSADRECRALANFHGCLTEIAYTFFETKSLFLKLFSLPRLISKFKNQLNRCLFGNSGFSLQEDDIIFMHTLYIFELIATAQLLRQKSQTLLAHNCRVIIGLNFRYIRNSRVLTFLLSRVYRHTLNQLYKKMDGHVILCSDGDLLGKEYERLLNRSVSRLPMPIYPLAATPTQEGKKFLEGKRPLVITFLGGARYNKGFDIFVEMLGFLINAQTEKQFSILVQYDLHYQQQLPSDTEAVIKAAEKLQQLAKQWQSIEVIQGTQSSQAYYDLLFRSDIVAIPYRPEGYRTVPSNIFYEALVAGKIPVVSCGTAMAQELLVFGLDSLILTENNSKELCDRIRYIAVHYRNLQDRVEAIRCLIQKSQSVSGLVDALLSFRKGKH